MNQEKIAKLIKELLQEIGEDPSREGLQETPDRVARSFGKLYEGYNEDPKKLITVFDNEGYNEMLIAKDIDFYSMCEHHMLPFFGKAHVAYIPNGKIVGLSKIPRVVDRLAIPNHSWHHHHIGFWRKHCDRYKWIVPRPPGLPEFFPEFQTRFLPLS